MVDLAIKSKPVKQAQSQRAYEHVHQPKLAPVNLFQPFTIRLDEEAMFFLSEWFMHLKWKLYTSSLLAVPSGSCNVLLCLYFLVPALYNAWIMVQVQPFDAI